MSNKENIIWNSVIVTGLVFIAVSLIVIASRPAEPCTLHFKVEKGVNFNDPLPIFENCNGGEAATRVIEDKKIR